MKELIPLQLNMACIKYMSLTSMSNLLNLLSVSSTTVQYLHRRHFYLLLLYLGNSAIRSSISLFFTKGTFLISRAFTVVSHDHLVLQLLQSRAALEHAMSFDKMSWLLKKSVIVTILKCVY